MTDQLMDDLTNEEHEALLLMSEHAVAPPLSLAAKAVLDAANGTSSWGADDILNDSRWIAAAALRAVAAHLPISAMYPSSDWGHGWRSGINDARRALLTIAAELEGAS